ncbi:MAG: prolipoprotein diacylglyceryl transferase, partial [Thermomicrobiales bacterium]|nr:prolipoprotein diacylglyceryl transferase [Thermomicrobiales bacterium]
MPKLSDPVAISIFGLSIRWYAIFILTGIVASLMLMRWLARERGLDPDLPLDAAPWVIIAALIGARGYYLLLKWSYYLDHPGEAINIRLGGLTVHGAIVGGILALWLYARHRGQPFLTWADIAAAALPVGQAIGRWGNWANQEAFGRPSDRPWAVTIDPAHRPPEYAEYSTFHPAFLYESVLDLFIAIVLIWIVRTMPRSAFWREGDAVWVYCILYGLVRFAIESLRTDSLMIGPFPAAYWLSWALISIGVVMFVARRTVWPGTRGIDL